MNVGNDRERADITDFGKDRRSASAHTPKSTLARSQDHPGAESHAPPSPLQASPMTVEHALGVPIFTDFQNAFECIRSHGTGQLLHYGRQGKGGGSTFSSQPSIPRSGICAIGSWNLGT